MKLVATKLGSTATEQLIIAKTLLGSADLKVHKGAFSIPPAAIQQLIPASTPHHNYFHQALSDWALDNPNRLTG